MSVYVKQTIDIDVLRIDDSANRVNLHILKERNVLFTSWIGVVNIESKSQINNEDKFMKINLILRQRWDDY